MCGAVDDKNDKDAIAVVENGQYLPLQISRMLLIYLHRTRWFIGICVHIRNHCNYVDKYSIHMYMCSVHIYILTCGWLLCCVSTLEQLQFLLSKIVSPSHQNCPPNTTHIIIQYTSLTSTCTQVWINKEGIFGLFHCWKALMM